MRNSWLDKYTSEPSGGKKNSPRLMANIVVCFLATIAIGTLIAGSMWVQMEDSQNALAEISSSHAREMRHTLKEKATSLLSMTVPQTEIAVAETVSADEEVLAMQSISDLEAANDGSKMDPFSPLVTSGSAESGVDPTKPKDVLDDVQFTGFIKDNKAKEKVVILRVGTPGNVKSLVKKVGEAFYVDDQKLVVKDVRNNVLYLSAGGLTRTLMLTPYQEGGIASSGISTTGSGTGTSAPASSAAASGKSLNLEEL